MFKKSNLTNLEYRLLLFATPAVPIVVYVLSLIINLVIDDKYFSPPRPTLMGDFGNIPTLEFFRVLVIVSLLISTIFVFFKRIFISAGLYLLSFAYFIFWSFVLHESLQRMLKTNSERHYIDFPPPGQSYAEIFIRYLNLVDILLLFFIIFLFLWHIKIVIQDYRRGNVVVS
jgi:hypothetical protein